MLLKELLIFKFVFLRYENDKLEFWAEDASGYVDNVAYAGIYNEKDVIHFNLRCFTEQELKKNSYVKNKHFAVSVIDAIKYFM